MQTQLSCKYNYWLIYPGGHRQAEEQHHLLRQDLHGVGRTAGSLKREDLQDPEIQAPGPENKALDCRRSPVGDKIPPWPYKAFYQLSIMTGLRTGEALGLKFEDFDVKNRVIRIRRSLTRGVLGLPKTESSIREVAMLRQVWELLEQRRRMNAAHPGSSSRSTTGS